MEFIIYLPHVRAGGPMREKSGLYQLAVNIHTISTNILRVKVTINLSVCYLFTVEQLNPFCWVILSNILGRTEEPERVNRFSDTVTVLQRSFNTCTRG